MYRQKRQAYSKNSNKKGMKENGGRRSIEGSFLVAIIVFSFKDVSLKHISGLIKSHWQSMQIWGWERTDAGGIRGDQ